jgi:outer membrane beta-barrel protein
MPFKPSFTVLALLAALPAFAQTQTPAPAKPAEEQVIVPRVERREVKLPRFASNDFSLGLFAGQYSTPNFGSSGATGLRLGYHVTEDVFVEGSYGRSSVTDQAFRQIFPNGGIFVTPRQPLTYYNVVAGYNILPGEVFFGRDNARVSQGYLVAGVGSTTFAGVKRQTVVGGFGLRVVFSNWFTAQADVRDHVYSIDLLGKRQSTQNMEVTAGFTVFF